MNINRYLKFTNKNLPFFIYWQKFSFILYFNKLRTIKIHVCKKIKSNLRTELAIKRRLKNVFNLKTCFLTKKISLI